MAEGLYCYQCEQGYPVSVHPPRCNEAGERVCPLCSSDFIELSQDDQPDTQLLRGLRTQLGLPQVEEPSEPSTRPAVQHHSFVTPGGTRVAVSLTTTTFTADRMPTDGSNMIIAALTNAFGGGQNPTLVNLGNLLGGATMGVSMGDFSSGELGLEQILQRLMDQYQPQATPAASTAVAALPRLRVASAAEQASGAPPAEPVAACRAGDPCTVCHDEFEGGAEVMQLPCKHCFHQDCLLPWLDTHNTCPVCRHALPVETNPRRATSQRDPEELHHPAVEAALSGIGQGHAHRTQSDGQDNAPPFWVQRERVHQMQDQQTQVGSPGAGSAPARPGQLGMAFQDSIRQAMTNAVNLGDAAEAANSIQELAQSLQLSNDPQHWTSGRGHLVAFTGHGRPVNWPHRSSAAPLQYAPSTRLDQQHDHQHDHQDDESMPALLDSEDDTDEEDDDIDVMDVHGAHGASNPPHSQHAARAASQPRPMAPNARTARLDQLDSHPAGSSIDEIDIELPLIQDEYASSEDALEGTSGNDEDMPSLLQDELASSGSDLAANDGPQIGTCASHSPPHAMPRSAVASDMLPDRSDTNTPSLSSASSMTARSLLDPAQACAAGDLPNKRLKRDGAAWSENQQSASGMQTRAGPDQASHDAAHSQASAQQTGRSFGGPITWARRGAGALTSWALGMAGLRN